LRADAVNAAGQQAAFHVELVLEQVASDGAAVA